MCTRPQTAHGAERHWAPRVVMICTPWLSRLVYFSPHLSGQSCCWVNCHTGNVAFQLTTRYSTFCLWGIPGSSQQEQQLIWRAVLLPAISHTHAAMVPGYFWGCQPVWWFKSLAAPSTPSPRPSWAQWTCGWERSAEGPPISLSTEWFVPIIHVIELVSSG